MWGDVGRCGEIQGASGLMGRKGVLASHQKASVRMLPGWKARFRIVQGLSLILWEGGACVS
jgi:hypothetical protein